jgi:hypothetical protein
MSNRSAHLLCTLSAAVIAATITVSAHLWGRGAMGNVIGILGFPGIVAVGDNDWSDVVFSFVNWLFWLSVLELALALRSRYLRQKLR